MRAHRAYFLGCGLALPLLALLVSLEVPTVAAAPQKSALDVNRTLKTDVNRTLKGDRLPLVGPSDNASTAPTSYPRLPEGCEAAVSAMTRSSLARIPARCIS
jgi:hypothetical protein